jgi:hypothetical protein
MKKCKNCENKIENRSTYCSNKCQSEFQKKEFIKKWQDDKINGCNKGKNKALSKIIRNYLLDKVNKKCEDCGWNQINKFTKKSPLEIHHVDGNSLNNDESNLKVLCPNCHSLTPNYKNANKESARKLRNKPM